MRVALFQFSILFIVVLFNHCWIFAHEQFFDGIIFWSVKNLPHVNSIDYFKHIFTNFSGHAGQYRPLGFFGYFYILGQLFDSNFILYSLVSLIIFTLTAYQIKKWALFNFHNEKIAWFSAVLYIFAPATLFLVFDISCGGKYLLTSLILIYQLNYIDQKVIGEINFKNATILFVLNLIAFLLHEGCLTFPIVILLYTLFRKKRVSFYYVINFYPSILFIYFRFIVFKAPSSGIMHVGLNRLWENYSELSGVLWNPIFNLFNVGYLGSFSALIIALIVFYKKRKYDLVLFFIMNLILISPFLFLDSHLKGNVILKGAGWALIPTVIFVASSINSLELTNRPKFLNGLLFSFLVIVNIFFYEIKKRIEPYLTEIEVIQKEYLARIRTAIHKKDSEYIRITGAYYKFRGTPDINNAITIYQSENIPGMLLKYFPNQKFILTNSARYNNEGVEMETLVQDGYYLYVLSREENRLLVVDRFNFQSTLNQKIKADFEVFDFPEIDQAKFF
ncbi:MAG: hypothetical protein U0T83_09895 [Bacteriovoracaceae bacterium]